jgi:acyl-CoA synthetase (NDP forming)
VAAAVSAVAEITGVARGRSYRDALRRLLDQEHFDRIIVSATESPRLGLTSDDLKWLLKRARPR